MRLVPALVSAMTLACSGSDVVPPPSDSAVVPGPVPAPITAPPVADEPAPVPLPHVPAADPKTLAASHNGFGLDLWKALAKDHGGNFALSPASLALAFSMVEAGARGDTLADMRKVLHLSLPEPSLHAGTGALVARWNAAAPYTLRVANRLFGEQTTRFHAPFLDLMKGAYGAPLEPVDFVSAFEEARARINAWVAGATEQKILDLLPPASLDELSRLVLVNAVYFKGQWATRFDKAGTHDQSFFAADKTVAVPMMHQSGSFRFARLADASLVELPYTGDDLAMTLVLPGDGKTLVDLEAALSTETLARWAAALREEDEVDVALPRFKVTTDSISLKSALIGLGMGSAFTPAAHFEGMTDLKPLSIDDAFHKVFVEVNEEGTEAAAATAVVMSTESAGIVPSFVADRPFLFLLRDLRSGHVLFMGRVTNPLG